MPDAIAVKGVAWEDSGVSLMARIVGVDGSNIAQADVSSIAYGVTDITDPSNYTADDVDSGTLTVSSVVFNSLQTDSRWTADTTGYNFRYDLPAASLPNGGKTYRIECLFTSASGEAYYVVFEIDTKQIFRS